MSPKRGLSIPLFAAAMALAITATRDAPAQKTDPGFNVSSPVFEEGQEIPTLYTCTGSNMSPPLSWTDPPRAAASFALVMDDPDAREPKSGRPFVHWVLFNVPPETRSLAENIRRNRLPGGAAEGTNDFKREGYDGPCPPSGRHRYVFTLYALDTMLDRARYQRANYTEIERALQGHVVATTSLVGIFEKVAK